MIIPGKAVCCMPEQALQPVPYEASRSVMRLPETICNVYLALMASVYFLYFNIGEGLGNISGAKQDAFFFLTGIYLGSLLLACLALYVHEDSHDVFVAEMRLRLRRPSIVLWALLAYVLMTLISALLSPHPEVVWFGEARDEGFVTILMYVLIFASLMLFARPKPWLVYVLGVTIIILSVISALQIAGGDPLDLYPGSLNWVKAKKEYLSTIGNIGYIGAFLCVAIPLQITVMIRSKAKWRVLLILPLAASVFLLLAISVLAAYVGLFVGGLIAMPFVLRFSDKLTKRYFIALGICTVLGLLGLYVVDVGSGMFHEMHEILHGNLDDKFGTSRIFIWRRVIQRIPERPWFGFGPDTMGLENIEKFSRYDEVKQKWIYSDIDVAHNEYLNIQFHQGVFALLAYLTALVSAAVHFFRYGKKNAVVAACGAGVMCYAFEAFFGISVLIMAPVMWISLGLMEGAVARMRERPELLDATDEEAYEAAANEDAAAEELPEEDAEDAGASLADVGVEEEPSMDGDPAADGSCAAACQSDNADETAGEPSADDSANEAPLLVNDGTDADDFDPGDAAEEASAAADTETA